MTVALDFDIFMKKQTWHPHISVSHLWLEPVTCEVNHAKDRNFGYCDLMFFIFGTLIGILVSEFSLSALPLFCVAQSPINQKIKKTGIKPVL